MLIDKLPWSSPRWWKTADDLDVRNWMRLFALRRSKKVLGLPPVKESVRDVILTPTERTEYEALSAELRGRITGATSINGIRGRALCLLTRMRRSCDAPLYLFQEGNSLQKHDDLVSSDLTEDEDTDESIDHPETVECVDAQSATVRSGLTHALWALCLDLRAVLGG